MEQAYPDPTGQDFRIDDYPVLRMARIVAEVQDQIVSGVSGYPLAPPSWRVLALLADRGAMTVKALAAAALVERSSLSRTIMRMEDDGLLARTANPADGRSSLLCLSERGRTLFDESQPVAITVMGRAAEGLSAEEMVLLFRLLDRMIENLAGSQR